jgi:hypothetical protein
MDDENTTEQAFSQALTETDLTLVVGGGDGPIIAGDHNGNK